MTACGKLVPSASLGTMDDAATRTCCRAPATAGADTASAPPVLIGSMHR